MIDIDFIEEWSENNKESRAKIRKKYSEKDSTKEHRHKYYIDNKEDHNKRSREWREMPGNRERLNERHRQRYMTDVMYKLKFSMRNMVYKSMINNGYNKRSKTATIIGCTFEELKKYIESKFDEWMSWDNYGLYNGEINYGWDFDHIVPLSSAKTEEEIIKLNNFKNIQPLCSKINRDVKRDKLWNHYILT